MSMETTIVEKAIIRNLVAELATAGFVPVSVWDSEEYEPTTTADAVIAHLYAVDFNCTIHFAPAANPQEWGNRGVLVVTGNGCDIISDWHCGDEAFDAALERTIEKIETMGGA